ncbi:DMT family transporter [Moraxella nasovis]|uniref:DMT family transporter n=1 Tax=Moraxella nasovis TaxID=2904121 RepID=UPI001F60A043|nr:DMT family transporter [Moraxella nasovis]UNU72796.1 DMT family transporter [Moraxella nasovis]
MMNKIIFKPEIFAVIAAILNGTSGVFTRWAFNLNTTPATLAFWKCFLAFVLMAIFCTINNQLTKDVIGLVKHWKKFALLSFLGIFCLYFFETWAFNQASIPLVSFLTYAAGIITLLLSVIFLKEKITVYKIIAFCSIIAGVFFMLLFAKDVKGSLFGVVFALLGGLGYALFIFMSKILKVGSGIAQLFWLFLFGSLFCLYHG